MAQRTVTVNLGGQKIERQIGPGISRLETPVLSLPVEVKVTADGEAPLVLDWVQVRKSDAIDAVLSVPENYVQVQATSTRDSSGTTTQVSWMGTQPTALPGWMELRVHQVGATDDGVLIGSWPIDGKQRQMQARLSLTNGAVAVTPEGASSATAFWTPAARDGTYVAELRAIYADDIGQPVATSRSTEVLRFSLSGGSVVKSSLSDDQFFDQYIPHLSWRSENATFGDSLRLIGYTWDRTLRPGKNSQLSLYWRVPKGFARDWVAMAQLKDENGESLAKASASLKNAIVYEANSSDSEIWRIDCPMAVDGSTPAAKAVLNVAVRSNLTYDTLPIQSDGPAGNNQLLLGPFDLKRPDTSW